MKKSVDRYDGNTILIKPCIENMILNIFDNFIIIQK